jgi:hypothetical protein
MLYMIVEHFKNDDPLPIYRRFRDRGRLAPDGLIYVSSWVDEQLHCCYQLMETEDRTLIDRLLIEAIWLNLKFIQSLRLKKLPIVLLPYSRFILRCSILIPTHSDFQDSRDATRSTFHFHGK